jgi:hypothetical protein
MLATRQQKGKKNIIWSYALPMNVRCNLTPNSSSSSINNGVTHINSSCGYAYNTGEGDSYLTTNNLPISLNMVKIVYEHQKI